MADKKLVEAITPMEEDFAQWYTDVVKKAELMAYSSIKGCMIFRPNGYAIWESVQKELDRRFKETGVENVYMPMFIPESLLQKEKDHVEGFAPEVAWVTQGGLDPLQERMCVRPTSETLFCDFYKDIIQSYRDLPKCYNQWCSVVRWEKTTRPFLRSMEFLWQEGHTVHATAEDAEARTIQMLNVYADFCENVLAIPMIKGRKTDPQEGSYTTYLFEKGKEKILKKVGEECTEVIIAGEKEDKEETVYEISDLAYHVLVLMVSAGITVEDVTRELEKRHVIDHKVKQERMQ